MLLHIDYYINIINLNKYVLIASQLLIDLSSLRNIFMCHRLRIKIHLSINLTEYICTLFKDSKLYLSLIKGIQDTIELMQLYEIESEEQT